MMITQNLSIKQVNRTIIFRKMCGLGHLELLQFLQSFISRKEFIEKIFKSSSADVKPIESAVWKSQLSILKYLLDMTEVRDRYKNNDPMIFRLCVYLFVRNSNSDLTDYVLSVLQISKEKVVQMMSYKYPKQSNVGYLKQDAKRYHKYSIIDRVIFWGSFDHLQRLIDVI